ncbi:hypothetical protein AAC387_Pa08g2195 [Persea americana]
MVPKTPKSKRNSLRLKTHKLKPSQDSDGGDDSLAPIFCRVGEDHGLKVYAKVQQAYLQREKTDSKANIFRDIFSRKQKRDSLFSVCNPLNIDIVSCPKTQAFMTHRAQSVAGFSGSSSSSKELDIEDDRMIAVVLSEEYAKLDGAVARRLSHLSAIPHIPRINSYIPNLSDAGQDHQRLLQRLNVYGLYEVKVSGDGNCQFRAISDQMFKSPEYHKYVRKEIVKQLKQFRSLYEGYVPMKYKRYCKKMAKSGEWGDHLTLQAAADKFGAKICLLTSFRDTCFVEIIPREEAPQRELWLSFFSEVHYNSLYEIQDAPVQKKPRKKHWLF